MKKSFLLVFYILFLASFLGANIESRISSKESALNQVKSKKKVLSRELENIANEIKRENRKVKQIESDIKVCKSKISRQQKKTTIKTGELNKIEVLYKKLTKREKKVSKKVINILSKELSIQMLLYGSLEEDSKTTSLASIETDLDAIVLSEILKSYNKLLKDKFHQTKIRYIKLNKNIDLIKSELSKISVRIDNLKDQQKKLQSLRKLETKTISKLNRKRRDYIKKLNLIKKEQNAISKTLQKLHITKKEKIVAKEKERKIKEREREEREKTVIKESGKNSLNVRQIGSSYQKSKIAKYKGKRTISPLKSYTVSQRFGNYTDPIYNIKIFNESVILKSKKRNSKVRSVLDGKIIYANKTPMLDNVVIVKHDKNIHTIYAHLSQIAPSIKAGQNVKEGYVLGRVNKNLTFEVTQNEKHINPLKLIK
jgi:murein DD-endopeptidase MepM/ murein hydrolase activator NlpD